MLQRLELFWNTYFDFHYGMAVVIGILLFAVCAAALFFFRKKQGGHAEVREVGILVLFCVYLTFLFGVTLLNRRPEESYSMELMPLWSYQESILNGNVSLGEQIIYNIAAFFPFGIFLPVLILKMQKLWRSAAAAAVLSAFIELTQLIFKCGLCELDDVINNTLGAAIGYGIWKGVSTAVNILRKSNLREDTKTSRQY